MDRLDRVTHGLGQLGYLEAGVSGVAATVIEEVADIVRLEYLDQALVLGTVGFQALELVAAGTEGAGGRVAQGGNVLRRFQAGVDQIRSEEHTTALQSRENLVC